MALYGGSGGGRHGPYWRRQHGTTLPGELTLGQLNQINKIRRMMGLPPLNPALSDAQLFPTMGAHPTPPRVSPGPPGFGPWTFGENPGPQVGPRIGQVGPRGASFGGGLGQIGQRSVLPSLVAGQVPARQPPLQHLGLIPLPRPRRRPQYPGLRGRIMRHVPAIY